MRTEHDCKENISYDSKIVYQNNWQLHSSVFNTQIKYCPYCGVELLCWSGWVAIFEENSYCGFHWYIKKENDKYVPDCSLKTVPEGFAEAAEHMIEDSESQTMEDSIEKLEKLGFKVVN